MIVYWNYWILIMLLAVFVILWFRQRIEFFEDSYPGFNTPLSHTNRLDDVENKYINTELITENIKKDNEMVNKYELENKQYIEALYKTFNVNEDIPINQNEWSIEPVNRVTPSIIQDAFKYTVEFIEDNVKTSTYLQIPNKQSLLLNNIRIADTTLVAYRIHKKLPSYILNINMVLLRENDNVGKHIEIFVKVDKMKGLWDVTVLHLNIIGTLTKDQISEIEPTDALNNNINVSPADYITPDAVVNMDDKLFNEYCNTDVFGTNQEKECISSLSDTKIPHRVNLN